MSMPHLFSPYTLGNVELSNRVVMAPMTRCRASADHVPTPIMAEYYAARATCGLIISEGIGPDANGCGYARIPGLWSEAQVEGWRAVTDAVHKAGGRIAAQLMHTGRVGHPLNIVEGGQLLAPSAVGVSGQMYTDQQGPQDYPVPAAMTEAQVIEAIDGFVVAARHAIEAGFDLVELHGANGYLIDQFISPNTNLREDQWGGDIQGRGRFALTVARAVADEIGPERVGIRLSPMGVFNDIVPWETLESDFAWLVGQLKPLGLAYLHLVDHSAMGTPEVPATLKATLKEAFGGTVILSGGYDAERAEADLSEGKGELVAFGRPFISNPDLVERFKQGAELASPDFNTFYTPGPEGYTDYATLD